VVAAKAVLAAACFAIPSAAGSRVTVRVVGVVPPPVGVTAAERFENGPWPTEFTAATSNVYWVPLVSPEMTVLVAAPSFTCAVVPTCVLPAKVRTR
jgi:hypothetical protein